MGKHSAAPRTVATRSIPMPHGFAPLTVGAPTFSGTVAITVAPGVTWSAPPSWTVHHVVNGVYIVEPDGHIHVLRANEFRQVEEIDLPAERLPVLRRRIEQLAGALS